MFSKAKSTNDKIEKTPKPAPASKEEVQPAPIKWLNPQDEIEENLLDEVAGGINPQPLPPRGDDFRKSQRQHGYIGETEKN